MGGRGRSRGASPDASTEPRPRGRGWRDLIAPPPWPVELQRSPDLAVGDGALQRGMPRAGSGLQRSPDLAVGDGQWLCNTISAGYALQRSPDLAVGDGSSAAATRTTPVCFNGAPTSRSGMVAPPGLEGLRLLASTEPRPRGRGWAEGRARRGVRGLASTEPRPRGRGWDLTALESLYALVLQRSPDLAVGDGSPAPATPLTSLPASTEPRPRGRGWPSLRIRRAHVSTLQRSPDLAVGDGAAGLDAAHPRFVASTEPRPRGRGWSSASSRSTGHGSRFNGAPTSRSGMGFCFLRCLSRFICFNGAPTSRSGMVQQHLEDQRQALRLQRSPDLAVGDGACRLADDNAQIVLQRSPDLAVGDGGTPKKRAISWTCFNGAPTSRSGMGAPRHYAGGPLRASTEPRPRGRGWRALEAVEATVTRLQRSPDLAVGDGSTSP